MKFHHLSSNFYVKVISTKIPIIKYYLVDYKHKGRYIEAVSSNHLYNNSRCLSVRLSVGLCRYLLDLTAWCHLAPTGARSNF